MATTYTSSNNSENMSQLYDNYQNFQGNTPSLPVYNNSYLDTSDDQSNYADEGIADEIGSVAGTGIGAYFGGPIGAAIGSSIGNMLGTGVNYLASEGHAENAYDRQYALQEHAFNLNQAAQQYQAQNEANSLRRAGMNPAQASANGAPTIQPGAAPMAQSGMADLFSGMANFIMAAKAPTEIEKLAAEKLLTEANTNKVEEETFNLTLSGDKLRKESEKLTEDIQSAKNINDVFEARNDFLKNTSPSIFDSYRAQLKATKRWDELPLKTRQTLDSLADGEIELGVGELQGLNEIIRTQSDLSKADKDLMDNVLSLLTVKSQLNDSSVMKALAKLPADARNKMYADMQHLTHVNKNLDADSALKAINEWIAKYGNDQWLIENGMSDEIERKKTIDIINGFGDMMKNLVPFAIGGTAAGRAATTVNRSVPQGATIPVELRDIMKNPDDPHGIKQLFKNFSNNRHKR